MEQYKKIVKQLTDNELMEMIGGFTVSNTSTNEKIIPVSMLKYGVNPVLKYGVNPVLKYGVNPVITN